MSTYEPGSKEQPFPTSRPEIVITESRAKPFSVDCRELPWWFGIPEMGNRTLWSSYDPPEWKLTSVTDMHAVRAAQIHDLEGIEIEVGQWNPETGWGPPSERKMYGRLTGDSVQWLAISRVNDDGKRVLSTFLDGDFDEDWGPPMVRRLEDRGRFVLQEDGSFQQRHCPPGSLGAGMFSVKIGDRQFTCLRVWDLDDTPTEEGQLVEAYLNQSGRTVLFRRYNGRRWRSDKQKQNWDERFPEQHRIVIDGMTFVHWYDCLTDLAFEV